MLKQRDIDPFYPRCLMRESFFLGVTLFYFVGPQSWARNAVQPWAYSGSWRAENQTNQLLALVRNKLFIIMITKLFRYLVGSYAVIRRHYPPATRRSPQPMQPTLLWCELIEIMIFALFHPVSRRTCRFQYSLASRLQKRESPTSCHSIFILYPALKIHS